MKIPVSLAVLVAIAAGMIGNPAVTAQQTAPAFDVVSVKRNLSGGPVTAYPEPGGLVVRNFNARELVELAYGMPEYQVTGGPEWAATERFDILAKSDLRPPYPQMLMMLRATLAQRFQLATRVESRDRPRYALVVARADKRLGPGLRAATDECVALVLPKGGPPPPPPPPGAPAAACPSMFGPGFMSVRQEEIATIAEHLAREPNLQRPVVDKTGLSGKYNADANWSFEGRPVPAGAPVFRMNPDAPDLFTALREQLGLRLQSERGPVEVLVIDRMERPTED